MAFAPYTGSVNANAIIAAAENERLQSESNAAFGKGVNKCWVQIGFLEAAVRQLCADLDPMIFKQDNRLSYISVPCRDIGHDVVIGFEYSRAVPARLSGPPEDCAEGEPERLEMSEVRLAGIDITQMLKSTVLDDIEEATLARIHEIQEEAKKEAP